MPDSTLSALTAAATVGDSDLLYLVTGGADRKVTFATLREALDQEARWSPIPSANYTATPASTSQITFADTTGIQPGMPLRYEYGGSTYYGIVTAVSADASITVAGAPLDAGTDLTGVWLGRPEQVQVMSLFVGGAYGDGADADLLANDMASPLKWMQSPGCLVALSVIEGAADSGVEPKVNIQIADAAVSTEDGGNGVQVGVSWVDGSAVAISASNYRAEFGDEIEVACTVAGGTGDAEDLTVLAVFVME